MPTVPRPTHEIQSRHPHLKVLLYTSESSQQDKRSVAQCNDIWIHYDVLVYSPTIGAGVDFNPDKAHFDAIMAWGAAGVNPVREFMQMVGRVRVVRSRTVHVHIPSPATSWNCDR